MKTALYDTLDGVADALAKCMKCGNCMAVCPVYPTEKREASYARGKLAIAEAVLRGELRLNDAIVQEKLFNCLVCTSCMQNCPCGADVGGIVIALRAAMARENGFPAAKRAIFRTLRNQPLFNRLMKTGASMQGLGLRRLPGGAGYELRFNVGLLSKRIFPGLAATPFREQAPERISFHNPKATAAFFTGCTFNYIFPEVAWDVVKVLNANDVEILVPGGQQCCGIALLAHGDVEGARDLARKNLDAMEACGAAQIVTACGSCGESWQHGFSKILADDPVYGPRAAFWQSRTFDISTFLTAVVPFRQPGGRVEEAVTYHDSCHLKKVMKVFTEPRILLQSIPGLKFTEMARPDACCGSGGSYTITHPETSLRITGRKIEDVLSTGADRVVTGCPGCMMQLSEGLARAGRPIAAGHYISLLARAYDEKN